MSTITHPTEPHIPAHALPGQETAVPPQHRHIGRKIGGLARALGKCLVIALLALVAAALVAVSVLRGPTPLYVSLPLAAAWIGLVGLLLRRPARIGRGRTQLLVTCGLVALGLLTVAASQLCAYTPAIVDGQGQPVPGSIAALDKVNLNGSDQWISLRGKSAGNPVLLFLAGGPGGSQMVAPRYLLGGLEDHFVVVNWDQPGAGKSYNAVAMTALTPERYVSDAHELVLYLRQRFHQDKIYLWGDSWGSILGVWLVQRYPELFHAYVGSGQMVAFQETDSENYQLALSWAQQRGDAKKVAELQLQGPPPYASEGLAFKLAAYVSYLDQYMIAQPGVINPGYAFTNDLMGPEYGLYDKVNFMRGLLDTLNTMWPQLYAVDLRIQAAQLQIPVYFAIGRHDVNAPAALAADYYGLLQAPHKELVWFEHSGHGPYGSEPAKFIDLLVNKVLAQSGSAR